ncbi:MAG: alpha/beta hydrolase [Gammaproteobacteria bacterium]|nr:alpha/beta hydrolase [Gammaproteobacteria bacterium]
MTRTTCTKHSLQASESHEIPVYLWEPEGTPVAVFQIVHGLGEHAARYERFALAAVSHGYAVCAHDHRGHGPHSSQLGFFAANNGWNLLVNDCHQVTEFLRQRCPEKPLILLGHSMGSYIAQSYAMRFGDGLAALILSGSTWPSRPLLIVGRLLARLVSWFRGKDGQSPLLDKIGFGDFNKRFEPARTELDWLSREPAEVDKYIDDPLCGGPYTAGLWFDLLGGLLMISTSEALRKIPTSLPLLITGGSDDPVGGENGMRRLAAHYEATGHATLSTRIYAGGRHEMLNETNRDEFTGDLLQWTSDVLAKIPGPAETPA